MGANNPIKPKLDKLTFKILKNEYFSLTSSFIRNVSILGWKILSMGYS